MKSMVSRYFPPAAACIALLLCSANACALTDDGWINLIGEKGFDHWRKPAGDWITPAMPSPIPRTPRGCSPKRDVT